MIIVLSVPHTGTRYTCKFLEHLGVNYRQYHSEPGSYEDLLYESGKAVIPMRDPILQFLSSHFLANITNEKATLKFCMTCWDLLGELEKNFDVEYLRLDADRQPELQKIAKHAGKVLADPYEIGPVGNQFAQPLDYEMWAKHRIPEAEEALAPYRTKYGY